jgi:transposase
MERGEAFSKTRRTTHGDLTDEEWELIADLVAPYSGEGRIGRPIRNDRRAIVNAIFYVAASGCQWWALPACYRNWNTVHRYHLTCSPNGTWERICDRVERQGSRGCDGVGQRSSVQCRKGLNASTAGNECEQCREAGEDRQGRSRDQDRRMLTRLRAVEASPVPRD